MLNRIVIMGRLTKKPELRRTKSGVAVTSFSLAVERDYKDADGNRETDFIDVVAWRGTAEFAAKLITQSAGITPITTKSGEEELTKKDAAKLILQIIQSIEEK